MTIMAVEPGPQWTDDDLLSKLLDWTEQDGRRPGRNRVMEKFGIGAGRAMRLLGLVPDPNAKDRARKPRERRHPPRPVRLGTATSNSPTANDKAWSDLVGQLETGQSVNPEPANIPEPGSTGPLNLEPSGEAVRVDRSEPDSDTGPDDSVSTGPGRTSRAVLTGLSVIALSAGVAIWSGWVNLGRLCGFGPTQLLPGLLDRVVINAAVALPLGMEAFAAIALRVWIGGDYSDRTRRYAKWSTLTSLVIGASGQVIYHLLAAAGYKVAPWPVVVFVSILPVAVLGLAAGLLHHVRTDRKEMNK